MTQGSSALVSSITHREWWNRAVQSATGLSRGVTDLCITYLFPAELIGSDHPPAQLEDECLEMCRSIEQFWKEHVQSMKIVHGTSALYLAHFKRHGISATYPVGFETMVRNIRQVWTAHEEDICPKTVWFRIFEDRFDAAQREREVTVSFSGNPKVTHEFTQGAKSYGGEWMREVRTFMNTANKTTNLLTQAEQEILADTKGFSDALYLTSPMVVKISVTNESLHPEFGERFSPFLPLDKFMTYVQANVQSSSSTHVRDFLSTSAYARLEEARSMLHNGYEVTVKRSIPASALEFEMVGPGFNFTINMLNEKQKKWVELLDGKHQFKSSTATS
ncbi:MAG: hypothetical protein ACHQT8_02630 [Chlamydiales bacterium]